MVLRVKVHFPLSIQWRGAGGNLSTSPIMNEARTTEELLKYMTEL